MKKTRFLWAALVALVFLAGGSLALAGDKMPESLDQARKVADARGVPLLMKVEADWCTACKAFQETYEKDTEFRGAASEGVVFYRVDGEKGEGIDIVRNYGVIGYPTFILTNASGEMMDSWKGYHGQETFLEQKQSALADPTTLSEKLARFRDEPTAADAAKLADLRLNFGYPAEAVAYYQRAKSLDPESDTNYDLRILWAMGHGAYAELFTTAQIRAQADVVFASANAKDMVSAYYTVRKVAHKAHTPEVAYPYLRTAYEAAAGSDDEYMAKSASKLLPDYALQIERDEAKAVRARKAIMQDGWQDDARALNQVAWWCFENRVNLAEAEELARKGVELAAAGTEKANVLDTLAEICNLSDDCAHAVQYIRLAIEEDPKNEYFQKQLVRFEEILAQVD